MDKELDQILRLYGEPGIGPESTAEDPALRHEREQLEAAKQMLDSRLRVAVPENVVRAVLEFEREDRRPQRRRDRRPVSHDSRRSRPLFAGAGTTLVLLLIAGVLIFTDSTDEATVSADRSISEAPKTENVVPGTTAMRDDAAFADAAVESSRASEPAPRRANQQAHQAATPDPIPEPRRPQVLTVSHEAVDPGLAWDDGQDLRRLHMMIDVVQERGDEIEWEEPAVPLELLPQSRDGARVGAYQGGFYQVNQPVPYR